MLVVCFVGSVEISGKFWAWLTGRLGDVCESCPSSCVDVQKEIVQGMDVLCILYSVIINI